MMFEIDDVLRMFSQEHVPESCIGIACRRLKRVTEIQRILLDQLTVLETMTPLGFLEFRGNVGGVGRTQFLNKLFYLFVYKNWFQQNPHIKNILNKKTYGRIQS